MAKARDNRAAKNQVVTNRVLLAMIGGLAGLWLWFLVEHQKDMLGHPRAWIFAFAAVVAFFSALLAMVGPLRLGRAALGALALALPVAGLMTWASTRFTDIGAFLATGHPLVAFAILVSVPLPFLIAAQRPDEGWRSYPALFNHAWAIVVRFAAAWLFVGVFWAVLMLSNALFNIIGLTVIDDLLKVDAVSYGLTGLVLGLAIAVVNELSDYVSPYLILRLLRLFLPPVLLVMATFVAVLPFRGMSGLFQGLSAAAVLMAMALAAITLVSTALDRADDEAVRAPLMRMMTQALALLLPVVAGLAGYAIWQRVAQYGWTPNRVAAASVAAVVMAYALAYALAVVMRGAWMAHIRRVNIYMALIVVLGAALWLTPVLDPQRIATRSQIARFADGRTPVETLDLWAIGRQWGRAGKAGLARLSADAKGADQARLAARLALLSRAKSRYQFAKGAVAQGPSEALITDVIRRLPVWPKGRSEAQIRTVLSALHASELTDLRRDCARKTPQGNPGCVLVFADLTPFSKGDEAIMVQMIGGQRVVRMAFRQRAGRYRRAYGVDFRPADGARTDSRADSQIDALANGNFTLVPTGTQMLRLKGGILDIGR